jgi:integrase
LGGNKKLCISKIDKVGFGFEVYSKQLEKLANELPEWKLKKLGSIIHTACIRRFRKPREPKYGSISKGFTELELQHFLRNVRSEKFGLLFKYQAYMGLRVGEVCRLHISNIDFDKRELTIKSEKSNKMDALRIPAELFAETAAYIMKYEANIERAKGHLFFKDNNLDRNGIPHLDGNHVRNVFCTVRKRCGLDQVYCKSEESYGRKERNLHRLTTHSLRHFAITRFSKSTNGNIVLANRFARHTKIETTMHYIAKDKDELYKNIDIAFDLSALERLKNRMGK